MELNGNTFSNDIGLTEAATIHPATCNTCGAEHKNASQPQITQQPVQLQQHAAPGRNYIYVIGRIEHRFPLISIEKEYAQLLGATDTTDLGDREAFYKIITAPQNRYLARQLCWVLVIFGIETYIVVPRSQADLDLLIESMRPKHDSSAIDVVIGMKGPIAPHDMCNGLSLPIVAFDQLYSFDRETLIKSIPSPEKYGNNFDAIAAEVLDRILLATDNAGASDTHRALNYLALRYPGIYATAADCFSREMALTGINAHPWRLSATRKIVEVIITFTQRKNEFVEKFIVRVDVNDEFPFLNSRIAPFYEH